MRVFQIATEDALDKKEVEMFVSEPLFVTFNFDLIQATKPPSVNLGNWDIIKYFKKAWAYCYFC